jgi:hypothetical protein
MTRQPIVAGQFYPADFSSLDKKIKDCFLSKFGPGDFPITKREKDIIGIISPHAGYPFSGPCAAWAFKEIAESKFPDIFIMLGLSHSGHQSCKSVEDWATPFGIVKTDKSFLKEIDLPVDEEAHSNEHSIEVQLPFLQFANKDLLDKIRIAPIMASHDIPPEEIASIIFKAVKDRNVIVIASSDFTHYGPNYGYMPFSDNIKDNMYKLDKGALDNIKKLNSKGFLDYTDKTHATICGRYPIATLLELVKKLGAKKASLLHYYTSGDVIGDYRNSVGYASIKIK